MNLFENIFNKATQQAFWQAGQAIKQSFQPLTDYGTQAVQQNVEAIKPAIQPIQQAVTKMAEPIVKPIQRQNKVNKVNDFIASKWLTVDHIKELARMDWTDPEEAIQSLRSLGIKVQWMEENPIQQPMQQAQKSEDWLSQKSYFWDQRPDEWFLEQAGKWIIRTPLTYAQNAISWPENIVQWSMNLLEKTLGEGALNPLLNVAGSAIKWDQYKPLPTWYNDVPSTNQYTENIASNIFGAGKEALTTDKTYEQARQELAQQQYKAGKDQWIGGALSNKWGGTVSSAFNILAPWASALCLS